MQWDAIIVGAGACGLMCAVQAGRLGKKVLLLEANQKAGAKILISGGGRCNFTNLYTSKKNFISEDPDFCETALEQWSVEDTIQFFEAYGIKAEEKKLGQLFPGSNKAADIVRAFTSQLEHLGQRLATGSLVHSIRRDEEGVFIVSYRSNGQEHTTSSRRVVIASGGLPIPKLGATDFALKTATEFDMPLVPTAPALVPLTVHAREQPWFARLSGTSVHSTVSAGGAHFSENVLLTHWGLSGPAVLQASSYWRPGKELRINLLPDHSWKEILKKERENGGRKEVGQLIQPFFSKKFIDALADHIPIERKIASLGKKEATAIDQLLHHFTLVPAGDKGYQKAEVMRGGVDTRELNAFTLESKRVPGLFFGGECVDVTGWLGGYNFQWAWASGTLIARNL